MTILEEGSNLWFGAADNVAMRRALDSSAAYVWLVNNDAVVAPDALSALLATAEAQPEAGAVGSVIFEADDRARAGLGRRCDPQAVPATRGCGGALAAGWTSLLARACCCA